MGPLRIYIDRKKQLNGKIFDGHRISVTFQIPGRRQTSSFSIEIKGLPVDAKLAHLEQFASSTLITLGVPSYDRDAGIEDIRRRLGMLESFDVMPTDSTRAKITAFAQARP